MILLILLPICFLALAVLYARWNYGVLEGMGVPVVKPGLLFGSIPDLHTKVIQEEDMKHFREFGPVYGVYEGRTPVLYVCDAELIKGFTVAEFHAFRDRREKDYGNRYFNQVMDLLPYETWRVVRSSLMPAFSLLNLKSMYPRMECCLDETLKRLNCITDDLESPAVIDIRRETSGYAAAVAALNMFGIKVPGTGEDGNGFRLMAEETIGHDAVHGAMYSMSLVFPFLTKLAPTYARSSTEKLKKMITLSIEAARRGDSKTPPTDLITRMIALLDKVGTKEFKRLGITETTIYSQAIVLFAVNYEGFSSILALLAYFLAVNKESRKKLQKELDLHFQTKEGSSSDVKKLPYLTACLLEVMRLAPIPRRIERICVQDCEINGMKVRKGMNVMVPLYAANRNPTNMANPEQFVPERFLPENKSNMKRYAATLFGHGPRNCAGQRYALDVLKFSAARLLHRFEFRSVPETKLKFKPGRMFIVQFEPIYLEVVKRY